MGSIPKESETDMLPCYRVLLQDGLLDLEFGYYDEVTALSLDEALVDHD